MAKNGITIFYDNEPIIRCLSGDSCKTLILDMIAYSRDGVVPPRYEDNSLNVALACFIPSIDRGKALSASRSISGRAGIQAKLSKSQQNSAKSSKSQQAPATIPNRTIPDHTIPYTPPNPLKGGAGECAEEGSFSRFWEAYPRKESRERALAAWSSLSPDETLLDRMLNVLEVQKCSTEWHREGGRYIPHAANWIKDRRWEDEAMPQCNDSGGTFDTETFFKDALAKDYDTPTPE